jgi:hypothetical protein
VILTPILIGLGMAAFVLCVAVVLAGGIDGFRTDPRARELDEPATDPQPW